VPLSHAAGGCPYSQEAVASGSAAGDSQSAGSGPELARELYVRCGLGLRHIELISGQPAETVRALLHAHEITLRPPGGRSPFMRRWRAALTRPW
jgi:hypothetical protein